MVILVALLMMGCGEKKDVANELDEKLEKSKKDFDQHAQDAMRKLDEMKNLEPKKIENVTTEDFNRGYMIRNGDTIRIKTAGYEEVETVGPAQEKGKEKH